MADPATPTTSLSLSTDQQTPITLSKTAIIWLSLLGTSCLIGLGIALFLLLRYSCTRASRRHGQRITDRRNEHALWWKHAHPPVAHVDGHGMETGTIGVNNDDVEHDSIELTGLRHSGAAMGEGGNFERDSSWPLGYGAGTGDGEKGYRVKSRFFGETDLRDEKL